MSYVDGFVCAVPLANRERYREHAERAAAIFRAYGALELIECWGDDVPDGVSTSFPLAVKRRVDENVVFSWIRWPSKQVRDLAWPKVIADMQASGDADQMPFDGRRMIFGGFEVIVDA